MSLVKKHFVDALASNADKSPAMAAIETLYAVLAGTKENTVTGLTDELKQTVQSMLRCDCSSTSVLSASELFMRFISLSALDQPNFNECHKLLLSRGRQFLTRVGCSRQKIVNYSLPFIKDGSVILTHSFSRVVCDCLLAAADQGVSFQVYVTESRPDSTGYHLRHKLAEKGITCTVILDAAAAYIMEKVHFVIIGAEGVVETGGVINKIGTWNIGLAAKAMNKPVYVMAESVKFVKEYPLNQKDIPDAFKYHPSLVSSGKNLEDEHPLVDYTPPEYIKLLFTDLGILTTAAVSDELIKLYL